MLLSEFTCNDADTCDINAECVYDFYEGKYVCQCADGFSGDGYYCSDTGEGKVAYRVI